MKILSTLYCQLHAALTPHLRYKKEASTTDLQQQVHWILRFSAAMCFIGHGAWGVITKSEWLTFFNAMAIPDSIGWILMPLVGSFDIAMGIVLLTQPRRIVLLWMTIWAVFTALLRPIAGLGLWEFWERAGNYGPPFILLIMGGIVSINLYDWFGRYRESRFDLAKINTVQFLLQVFLALLLIGHAGFGFFTQKANLVQHWNALGLNIGTDFIVWVGYFELALAAMVLLVPKISVFVLVLVWKLFSELLYPISGPIVNIFETIERWGDYGIPLALMHIIAWKQARGISLSPITMAPVKNHPELATEGIATDLEASTT